MIRLVSMPYASLTYPTLGMPLVAGLLEQAGFSVREYYFGFDFLKHISMHAYEQLAYFKGMRTQVSEWMFAKSAWGRNPSDDEDAFLDECARDMGDMGAREEVRKWLAFMRDEAVPSFLDDCLKALSLRDGEDIVGFSCSFYQTLASLALARRIRQRFPGVRIAFGGACCHGEMGRELIEKIEWIDAISTCESDDNIAEVYRRLRSGESLLGLQGVYERLPSGAVQGTEGKPVPNEIFARDVEPDFSGFFEGARRANMPPDYYPNVRLPFESSRGCWWGEKRQCTFCGMNGVSMCYRVKPAESVRRMLRALHEKYGVTYFQACDNNIAPAYEQTFFPRMIENPPFQGVRIHCCVKPSAASRSMLQSMRAAGYVSTLPGIESLSAHMLRLFNKGVTVMQNVRYLKCARQFDLISHWNILIRAPGEAREDYDEMARLIPRLRHLNPPNNGLIRVQCHRYSVYWREPEKYAYHMKPTGWYRYLYPEDRFHLDRLAYYFDVEWKDVLPEDAYRPLESEVHTWRYLWRSPENEPQFWYGDADGFLTLHDTRFDGARKIELDADESALYRMLDDMIPLPALEAALSKRVSAARVREILSEMDDAGLIYREGDWVIGLALQSGFPEWPFAKRSRMFLAQ